MNTLEWVGEQGGGYLKRHLYLGTRINGTKRGAVLAGDAGGSKEASERRYEAGILASY